MPAFSYTATFIPCPYTVEPSTANRVEASLKPNIDAFFANQEYLAHLNEMGASGWELVSTEAVLREAYASRRDHYNSGFPVTAGFFLFWKKSA